MNDHVWKRDEIQSPCVNICVIHPETELCTGCARTVDEIASWSRITAEARAEIMDDLPKREAAPKTRRGGRNRRRRKG